MFEIHIRPMTMRFVKTTPLSLILWYPFARWPNLSGELRLLAEAGVAAQFVRELGEKTWRELSRLALTDIRLALRAFALADADFASEAGRYEREFEELDRRIRLRLGVDALNRRELAPLLDFMSQIFLLVKTSLEVARGEARRDREAG